MGLKRRAAVAGSFYPRYKPDLLDIIESSFLDQTFGIGKPFKCENAEKRTIIGGVSPHAGYIYSGACASFTYTELFREKIPDTVIVLGTDHIGYGGVALMREGAWETPLGDLQIDTELASKILSRSKIIKEDNSAFMGFPFGREHNIEVQLPFIKYCAGDKEIELLPLKVSESNLDVLKTISQDIAESIKSLNKDIIVVASSDMSHEEVNSKNELEAFKKNDQNLIDGFTNLNPERTINPYPRASICGRQTVTTLILIGKELGVKEGKFLKYYTSSEKTGHIGGYCVGYFSGVLKL